MKTADEIMALDDRPIIEVDIPQWGIKAKVRELDAFTMARISASCRNEDETRDEPKFAGMVILEGSIEPKFEARHLDGLQKKSNGAIEALFLAIVKGKKNAASTS